MNLFSSHMKYVSIVKLIHHHMAFSRNGRADVLSCDNIFSVLKLHCSLFQRCLDSLVRTLRDVANSPYAPEYDIAGITDPFLHIRLLKLLRVLGHGDADASDGMNDILAQVDLLSLSVFFEFC